MPQEVSNVEQRTPQTQGQQTPQTQSAERNVPRPVFVPPADIYETGDSLVVMVEMPGVASDGVDITLERRVLTIRARSVSQQHAGYQGSTPNTPTAITNESSRFPRTSTATESRPPREMESYSWSCQRQRR
jgi:hypothetical protein